MVCTGPLCCPCPPGPPPRPCGNAAVDVRSVKAVASSVIRMRGFYSWEACPGSRIPDPRSAIADRGSGIRDPRLAQLSWRQDLSGIHQVLRVEGVLDGAHDVERVASVLGLQE